MSAFHIALTLGIGGFIAFGIVLLLWWSASRDEPDEMDSDDIYGDLPRVYPPRSDDGEAK